MPQENLLYKYSYHMTNFVIIITSCSHALHVPYSLCFKFFNTFEKLELCAIVSWFL
jgi:hypothetical protein